MCINPKLKKISFLYINPNFVKKKYKFLFLYKSSREGLEMAQKRVTSFMDDLMFFVWITKSYTAG